jgi:hypothetical protein
MMLSRRSVWFDDIVFDEVQDLPARAVGDLVGANGANNAPKHKGGGCRKTSHAMTNRRPAAAVAAQRRDYGRTAGDPRKGPRHLADSYLGRVLPRGARVRARARRPRLPRGDKLAVIGDNRPRLYWGQLAAQSLGGVAVPVYRDAIAAQ